MKFEINSTKALKMPEYTHNSMLSPIEEQILSTSNMACTHNLTSVPTTLQIRVVFKNVLREM